MVICRNYDTDIGVDLGAGNGQNKGMKAAGYQHPKDSQDTALSTVGDCEVGELS